MEFLITGIERRDNRFKLKGEELYLDGKLCTSFPEHKKTESLPSYPPATCLKPDGTPEPCEVRGEGESIPPPMEIVKAPDKPNSHNSSRSIESRNAMANYDPTADTVRALMTFPPAPQAWPDSSALPPMSPRGTFPPPTSPPWGGIYPDELRNPKAGPYSWPNKADVQQYQQNDMSYASPYAPYMTPGAAYVATAPMEDAIEQLQKHNEYRRPKNATAHINEQADVDRLTGAWAAGKRSPVAELAFNPGKSISSPVGVSSEYAGYYMPNTGMTWHLQERPSTQTHEDTHGGIALLRQAGKLPFPLDHEQEELMVRAIMNEHFGNIELSENKNTDPTSPYFGQSKGGSEILAGQAYPKQLIKNPKTNADRAANDRFNRLKALEDAAQNALNERVYQHTNMYHPGPH
jgi:hypothetical protein